MEVLSCRMFHIESNTCRIELTRIEWERMCFEKKKTANEMYNISIYAKTKHIHSTSYDKVVSILNQMSILSLYSVVRLYLFVFVI